MPTDLLPLFPLRLVPFPGQQLNLHIFEPRYRQMMAECRDEDKEFGICPYIDDQLMSVGTAMRITEVEQAYDDGTMDIRCQGNSLFSIEHFLPKAPDKLYAAGKVTRYANDTEPIAVQGQFEELKAMVRKLFEFLKIEEGEVADFEVAYQIAHHIGMSLNQEYQLLLLRTEEERVAYLIAHLRVALPMMKEMDRSKELIRQNGHFRSLESPEF